jgi:hypothetical protein
VGATAAIRIIRYRAWEEINTEGRELAIRKVQQLEQSLPTPRTNHSTQPDHCSAGRLGNRSSAPGRASRCARRSQGEAGLRGSAGAPTDASSKRPASSEGDRRAEEGSTRVLENKPARVRVIVLIDRFLVEKINASRLRRYNCNVSPPKRHLR